MVPGTTGEPQELRMNLQLQLHSGEKGFMYPPSVMKIAVIKLIGDFTLPDTL